MGSDPCSLTSIGEAQGRHIDDLPEPFPVYVGYVGSIPVILEAPFYGTVIVPNNKKEMGTGNAQFFFGEYVAKSLQVRSYDGSVTIQNDTSESATVAVPSGAGGETIHVILEIHDDGSPDLTSYRRVILDVSP